MILPPRILVIDIETTPILGNVWRMHDTNVLRVVEPSYVLMTGYLRVGVDDKPRVVSQPDFKRSWKRNMRDDSRVVKSTWHLLNDADLVIGQNQDSFDLKKLNARFLRHGLPAPSPFRTVDTLKVARKNFNHESNSLKYLAEVAGVTLKHDAGGMATWFGCMEGDMNAWAHMEEYCAYDVQSTYELYEYLRDNDWIRNHPNMAVINATRDACPKCGIVPERVQVRGYRHTNTKRIQRYQLLPCGHYADERTVKTGPKYV